MQTTKSWAVCVVGALVGAALCILPFGAQAAHPHYRIELRAPKYLPTCNDSDGLRDALNLALPESLLEPPATRVLEFRVDRAPGGGFVADVTAKELNGRVIASIHEAYPHLTECFKVLHKIAVSASAWLNELEGPFVEPPSPPATPSLPAPPLPPPPAPPQCPVCDTPRPAPPKPAPSEPRGFIGAGGFVSLGAAPITVVGLQFAGGWRPWRSWSFELDMRGTFPADAVPQKVTPIRVHSIFSVAFAPCYRIGAFGACMRGLFSNLWVEPITLASSDTETFQALGFGPRAFWERRLAERWTVRIDADLVFPFALPSIDVRSQDRWASPPMNGGASVSIFAWF